jgi:hypothetical protein
VDQFETNALQKVDDYIARTGLQAPQETVPQLRDSFAQEQITHLDLRAAGISTVIWTTGYSFDFSLVKLPVVDDDGYPIQNRGVTNYEGLYFLGMPWLRSRKSGILFGVGDDAAYISQRITARQPLPTGERIDPLDPKEGCTNPPIYTLYRCPGSLPQWYPLTLNLTSAPRLALPPAAARFLWAIESILRF